MSDAGPPADVLHMTRALELARCGLYTTTPNPRVGCVLVRDGRVIGEGYHERAGEAHAEVRAISDASARGESTRGSTAYVTLEPCNHVGRTGPCTQALIDAGVSRVVAAMHDPHPVARHGATRLREAGVAVDLGVLEGDARALNRGFIARVERGRPWVRMKAAASLDGRTALVSGESQWITGSEARRDGHHWRAQACAILTGIGTVRQDDPELTVRDVATTRQPLRVVLDRNAETHASARVLSGGATIVVTNGANSREWPSNVQVLSMPDAQGRIDLHSLMSELAARELNEIHVEAGAGLNGALLQAGLVDELLLYLAPCMLGDPARGIADFAPGLTSLAERVAFDITDIARVGSDMRIIADVKRS